MTWIVLRLFVAVADESTTSSSSDSVRVEPDWTEIADSIDCTRSGDTGNTFCHFDTRETLAVSHAPTADTLFCR